MRDKESVTQIFILYGYEKAPKRNSSRAFRIYHQALYLLNLQYLVFRQTSYFLDCRLIHTFC